MRTAPSPRRRSTEPTLTVFGLGVAGAISATGRAQTFQFDPPDLYYTISEVTSVTTGDFDRDGRIDLASTGATGEIMLYLNRAGGIHGRLLEWPTIDRAHSIRAGDFDGDGLTDLVWANAELSVEFLFSNGASEPSRASIPGGVEGTAGLLVADFDQDGRDEVAFSDWWINRETAYVHIVRSSGRRELETTSIELGFASGPDLAAGDFDGDGDTDIAALDVDMGQLYKNYYNNYQSDVLILTNNGQGAFETGQRLTLPYGADESYFPVRIEAGDLDNDGDTDFILLAKDFSRRVPAELRVIENQPDGFVVNDALTLADTRPDELAIGDLNADGRLDLTLTGMFTSITLFENIGDRQFRAPQQILITGALREVSTTDLNGDGYLDLAVGGSYGLNSLTNVFSFENPSLVHTRLQPGAPATFTVSGLAPNEDVELFYALGLPDRTAGLLEYGGVVLDLGAAFTLLAELSADANGVAQHTMTIPNVPPTSVTIQAAVRRGPKGAESVKSNFSYSVIR